MHRLGKIALGATAAFALASCSSDTTADRSNSSTIDTAEDALSTSTDVAQTSVPETTSSLPLDDRLGGAADALRAGDFSTMLQLLQLSGLADELEGREVTILAPTEDAFTSIDGDDLLDLLGNPSRIDDVLQRHVIDELLTYDELAERAEVTMLSGDTLAVSGANGVVTIGGAAVSEPTSDGMSGEGGQEIAVFGIDQVLFEG